MKSRQHVLSFWEKAKAAFSLWSVGLPVLLILFYCLARLANIQSVNTKNESGIISREILLNTFGRYYLEGLPQGYSKDAFICGDKAEIGAIACPYNAVGVTSESNVTNSTNAIGVPDNLTADIEADVGELILDLGQVIPQGADINLYLKFHVNSGGSIPVADVDGSISSAGSFTSLTTFSSLTLSIVSYTYTVNQVGGIQYLRVASRAISGNPIAQFVDVDALELVFCEICDNGIDDDGDGLVDCDDLDCNCCEAKVPVLSKN